MRVRLVQKRFDNPEVLPYVDQAVQDGCDAIAFGELTTTGVMYELKPYTPTEELLDAIARRPIPVFLGVPWRDKAGLRNACVYVHGDRREWYWKVHLFGPMNELNLYQPGNVTGLWDTIMGRTGVAICFDIRFPELFDPMRDAGVRAVIVPAAFRRIKVQDWRDLLVERARQTNAWVLGINTVGDDGTFEFGGSSLAVSPDGTVLAQADEVSETILDVNLPLGR